MSRIEWSPAWSVGDNQLDQEHQGLISLINRLAEVQTTEDPRIWRDCIAEVILYAENHFRHEEARMEEAHYPELERHRAGHLRFRKQIALLSREAEEAAQGRVPDLQAFLSAWLRAHILEEDRQYMGHLAARME